MGQPWATESDASQLLRVGNPHIKLFVGYSLVVSLVNKAKLRITRGASLGRFMTAPGFLVRKLNWRRDQTRKLSSGPS